MTLSETARQDLENDHRQLMEIFSAAIASSRSCDIDVPCNHAQCPQGCECARAVREQFHRIMFACIGRFGSEEKRLQHSLTSDSFQHHAESHANISTRIHQSITAFAASKDVPAAFESIKSIARAYEVHHRILDNHHGQEPLSGHLPKEQLAECYPLHPLPLTGDEAIDREHTLLFNQLQQALSICNCAHGQCTKCAVDDRQNCMNRTVELIGDALKFMVEHFRHEEVQLRMMSVQRKTEAHLRAHADIARQIGQLIEDYEDENTARCLRQLVGTLHGWLMGHIVEHDIPLYLHVARQGAEPAPYPA